MEMVDTALRGLMGAAAAASEGNLTLTAPLVSGKNPFGLHGVAGVMGPSHDNHEGVCVCLDYYPHGSQYEKVFAIICSWFMFAFSVGCLIFYAYEYMKATTGWEEVYVCVVELIKCVFELFLEQYAPCTITQLNGARTIWLRYGEWLLTCPVILIHLSNLTGLKNNYSKRTMSLLVSDLGTIVCGITAALATGPVKIVFFVIGLCYGCNTWFHAAKVYIEAYHSVPKGGCRTLVKFLAWLFFTSWTAFPLLFVFGPEGIGKLSPYASIIAHSFIDLMSKNLWGLVGHMLRHKIHKHILVHGDIRQKRTINVAGEEIEVEEFVEEENPAEGAVNHGTAQYAKRGSFLLMRDQMKAQGLDVRASLDGSDGHQIPSAYGTSPYGMPTMPAVPATFGGKAAPSLQPGRVILGVVDATMVDYFREQFASLPVSMELVPAMGADNILSVAGNSSAFGGADCVLLHPEYLRERGPASLVGRLKASGQRVCAFGWAPSGPMRELIESAGLDGWLEGPSYGAGVNPAQLTSLLAQMQGQRRMAGPTMYGTAAGAALNRSFSQMSNPAFNTTGRPMSPGGMAVQGSAPSDADMLQQLMAEISRLKGELGEGQ